jgi:hypothetical protein
VLTRCGCSVCRSIRSLMIYDWLRAWVRGERGMPWRAALTGVTGPGAGRRIDGEASLGSDSGVAPAERELAQCANSASIRFKEVSRDGRNVGSMAFAAHESRTWRRRCGGEVVGDQVEACRPADGVASP